MIGLENRDKSYFKVVIPNQGQTFTQATKSIISFSITEEVGKMLTGSVSFYDPIYKYHDILRMGKTLNIEWGYTRPYIFYDVNESVDQFKGGYKRTGIQAIIQSPSGSGSESGEKIYNCNFIGKEYVAGIKTLVHKGPTYADVIRTVLTNFGVSIDPAHCFINFPKGSTKLTADTYVLQYESDWKFLARMSFEWGALFDLSYNAKGEKIAMFATTSSSEYLAYSLIRTQSLAGSSMTFNYMNKVGVNTTMVRNFNWQQNGGGGGDNVQISMIGGQVQIMRYHAETERTVVYKLDSDKMAREMKAGNTKDQIALLSDWLSTNKFEDLIYDSKTNKGYFVPVVQTTAPQGLGYTINLKTLGNPMISPPCKVIFESVKDSTKNFPPMFQNTSLSYWIRKVTHTISRSGYECDVEVVDGFTASGGSFVY
jgi:hypothetical protein